MSKIATVARVGVGLILLIALCAIRVEALHQDGPSSGSDAVVKPPAPLPNGEINHASLEELMDMQISSVNRRPQKLSEAAAAIYVITREDIRRFGANSIPE